MRHTHTITICAIVSSFICVRVYGTVEVPNGNVSFSNQIGEPSAVRRKWISELIAEAEMTFDMDAEPVSRACRRDFGIYKLHAQNQTVWAIRNCFPCETVPQNHTRPPFHFQPDNCEFFVIYVFPFQLNTGMKFDQLCNYVMESTEWPKIGLFSGVTAHLGNYAECLRARGPGIKGQYCLAQAIYNFPATVFDRPAPGWTQWPEENASVWKVIKMHDSNLFRKSRKSLLWAMCIPSSCSATDLATALNEALYPVFKTQDLKITASVNPAFCKVQDDSHWFEYFSVVTYIFGFVILIAVSSTICDFCFGIHQVSEHDPAIAKLIKCFSVTQNFKSLIQNSTGDTDPFLNFLKIVFMVAVMWGHALSLYYLFPKFETEEMEMSFRPWSLELLGSVILNGFFLVSGFLRAFHFNFTSGADSRFSFFMRALAMKWLRMVPSHGLMMICFLAVFPFSEEGPFTSQLLTEIKCCKSTWWANLLAVQNMVDYRDMCLPHSWYIAADIQLFAIGTLLLTIFRENRKYGIYLIISTLLYAVIHTFFKIYLNASDRLFTTFYIMDVMNYRDSFPTLLLIHAKTFYRLGPYLMGYITAFVTKSLMEKSYKFSKMQLVLLILPSFVIGFGVQLYGFVFFIANRQINPLEMAVFGTLQPLLFVLPLAVVICIYFVSGFGILRSFFELKLFVPIARLAFSVYLIGLGIQSYHVIGQRRTLSRFSRIEIYWWIVGDVFLALLGAFLFYLVFEGPVNKVISSFISPYLVKKRNQVRKEILIERKNSHDSIQLHSDTRRFSGSSETGVSEFVRVRKTRSNSATNQVNTSTKHEYYS